MSMEEYEIECLKREADEEREPFKKLYATKEVSDEGKNYFDIAYCPTPKIDKMIRFSYVEHYIQFVDLLGEAGYKYFDEKLLDSGGIEELHLTNNKKCLN